MTASGLLLLRPDTPGVPHNPDATPAPRADSGIHEWINQADSFLDTVPLYVQIAAAVVLAGLIARTILRSRRAKKGDLGELTDTDRRITRITAFIATAVLAEGMWAFFVDVIDVPVPVRVVLFAFIELQLLAAARRARRHLYRVGSLGTAPFTVFGLAAVSATLAAVHAQSVEERLFRLFAAAVAAHMWIEELREERDILHHNKPGKYPPVRKLIDWERIAANWGLIEAKSHTASQIATIRRIDRLGRLLDRYHAARVALAATKKPSALRVWWLRRLDRRVVRQTQAACTHINLAEDPKVRMMLLRRLAVVRGVVAATDPKAADSALDGWITGQIGGRPVVVSDPIVVEPVRPAVSARPATPADPQVDVPLDGWEDTHSAASLGSHLSVDVRTATLSGDAVGSQQRSAVSTRPVRAADLTAVGSAGPAANPTADRSARRTEGRPARHTTAPVENPAAVVRARPTAKPTADLEPLGEKARMTVDKLARAFARKPTGTNAELAKLARVSKGTADRYMPRVRAEAAAFDAAAAGEGANTAEGPLQPVSANGVAAVLDAAANPLAVLPSLPAPAAPVMSGVNGHSLAAPTSPEEDPR